MIREITVRTGRRSELIDITGQVAEVLGEMESGDGACLVCCPHTTAGITINENADPTVRSDILEQLDRMVPWDGPYRHSEGNAAAHVKSSLMGASVMLPVRNGRLVLGTWQGIFLCEFDGPRQRRVMVKLIPDS